MKNKLLATIFVAMTFLPLIPLNAQKILGYWPYYRTGSASIQYSNYTDIVYAFLNPTTSGDLNFSDGNFNQLEFNYLVSQCVTNGVSPHISVGGANLSGPIASVAGNTTARGKFVSQIVSFVAGTHAKNSVALAGLDIDWEFPTDWTAKANHLQLIKDLRSALDAQGASDGNTYELAIAVGGSTPGMPAGGVFHTSYFNSDVINYVDFVYIMNYDLGSSGYPSSHHSPYQACVDALSYYTNTLGFPANKLLMGIPFYGRDWSSAYEWKNFATTTTYNSSTGISGSISFNSKPVIDQKVSHICSQGGAGVVVWEISQDASSDALSLSKALYDAFVASGCTPTGGGGSGGGGGGGGGGGSTSGDCVSSTSFNDDYDETFAPTNGDIQLSYWGSSGGVYNYTRTGTGDLDVKVTQAKNGWIPMGFSLTDPGETRFVDVTSTNKIDVSLTNDGSVGVEVYFSFISNNTTGASAQIANASSAGILFGGALAAGATMTQSFDVTGGLKRTWVGPGGPCVGGTLTGDICLVNTGFDASNLSGVEWSINGQGASVGGVWVQPAISNHSITVHYVKGGSADCVTSGGGGGETCSDGIKNQDETGIDCGGSTCPTCGGGSSGVEEVNSQLFVVYPNPANDVLNVSYNGAELATLVLSDVNGKVLYSSSLVGADALVSINVAEYKSGMYFVKLTNSSGTKVSKVIVK